MIRSQTGARRRLCGICRRRLELRVASLDRNAEEAESVLSELAVAIHRALAAANIEIPTLQREVHVRADGITAIGPNPGLQAVAADAPRTLMTPA